MKLPPSVAGADGKFRPGTLLRVEGTGEIREVVSVLRPEDVPVSPLLQSTAGQVAARAEPIGRDRDEAAAFHRKLARLGTRGALMGRGWLLAVAVLLAGCAPAPPIVMPQSITPPDLWLGSNVQTADTPRFLSPIGKSDAPTVFAAMDVYQFHGVHLLPGCGGISCGPNTWQRIRDERVLEWLVGEGKHVGVEHASIKEQDCSGDQLLGQLRGILQRTQGRLSYVAMDWPWIAAHHPNCQLAHAEAATIIAHYMREVADHGAQVVLIEGYPHWSRAHFLEHLDATLEAAARVGVPLYAVSLDIDVPRGVDPADLKALIESIRSRGARAGIILTGDDGSSETWADGARWRSALMLRGWLGCDVDYVLVESWARVGPAPGQEHIKLWPLNLPETALNTLTGIARTEACQ
jgi:hypothetical protein